MRMAPLRLLLDGVFSAGGGVWAHFFDKEVRL